MTDISRRAVLCLGVLASASTHGASGGAAKEATATPTCSASASLLALRLVDDKGQPVVGADIKVRRLSTMQWLPGTGPVADPGRYKLLEGGDLPDLRAGGEDFEVVFQKGSRTRRVRVRIGLDPSTCQAVLLGATGQVVF